MWLTSARFPDAIRRPHARVCTATHRNLITGTATDLPIVDGAVTVDAGSKVRRSLTLNLPGQEDLWQAIDTPGGEVTVTQGIRYTLTCPDRWLKVQRNRFGLARSSVHSNAAWQEIKRLVEACWGGDYPFPGWAQLDTSATTKVGSLVWDDGDREAAITALCDANGLEMFFDAEGRGVLRPIPVLTSTSSPVWMVDASASGVLIGAQRARDLSTVRNALIITTSATDVTFAPVEVKNTDPDDPLSVLGPLGYVPEEWSSPTFRNSAQAQSAGVKRLSKRLGVAKQLTLTAVGNPALDAEDVIMTLLPQIDRNTPRPSELHIIDSVSHPLMPTGTQDIQTRSTRPADAA